MEFPPWGGFVNYVIVDGFVVVGVGKSESKGGRSIISWLRGTTVVGGDVDMSDVRPWRWCEGWNGGGGRERPCHRRAGSGACPGRDVVVRRFHGRYWIVVEISTLRQRQQLKINS